jgi:hypothetical protein
MGNVNAEQRIKQLLSRQRLLLAENEELRRQATYMQTVAAQMIPLLSKPIVARILEVAKESSQPTKGEIHVSLHSTKTSPGSAKGAGTVGRQGTFCRHAQAGARPEPYRQQVHGHC